MAIKRKGIRILVGLILFSVAVLFQGLPEVFAEEQRPNAQNVLAQAPRVINNAFHAGERLQFSVTYGPFRAGTAVMQVEEGDPVYNRPSYRLTMSVESARWFLLYHVESSFISYADRQGFFSWQYVKDQAEGTYRNTETTTYNQIEHYARRVHFETQEPDITIEPFVRDVVSALYYVRTLPLEDGDTYQMACNDGRKNFTLHVDVLRRERIYTQAGDFDCVLVEPKLEEGSGIFLNKGRLFVWMTDDERHMPVRLRSEIAVGAIYATLESFTE